VHRRWTPLGVVGGCPRRHCALSPQNRWVASVASWFGRGTGGFRTAVSETVCRGVVSVHRGAGRGCRRIGSSMPCRHACKAGLDGAWVHGNVLHALRVLGGMTTSDWHDRGAMHGGSRTGVAWGIDRGCTEGLGGEVTAREMVGAGLPMLGVHGGHGGILGERGVAGRCHCSVGLG
jgi:hypothetical protein